MTAATVRRPEASATWRAIGVAVRLVVTDPVALEPARRILTQRLAELDAACSRFRDDSEIAEVERAGGRPAAVGPVLAEAVEIALDAARRTGGDLDPTIGRRLAQLGYDRTFADVAPDAGALPARVRVSAAHRVTWRDVTLDRAAGTLSVPAGVLLDLGATAKAWAADVAADAITAELGCAALVGLGGDIAVAGPPPGGGWPIAVQDTEAVGAAATVAITVGGLATSGTAARRWQRGSELLHHVLDPRTGMPARTPWRTITVAASTCLAANVAATTTMVRGDGGLEWLRSQGLPARLVGDDGAVTSISGWP